jgi:hypothetical protein
MSLGPALGEKLEVRVVFPVQKTSSRGSPTRIRETLVPGNDGNDGERERTRPKHKGTP